MVVAVLTEDAKPNMPTIAIDVVIGRFAIAALAGGDFIFGCALLIHGVAL